MTRTSKQRLVWIFLALLGMSGSLVLIFESLRDNLVFFFSPTELQSKKIKDAQKVRVGGMVKQNSLKCQPNQLVSFILTDYTTDLLIEYTGVLPDLFREGQGCVAEGHLMAGNRFQAQSILAKHDERYMPAEVKQCLECSDAR